MATRAPEPDRATHASDGQRTLLTLALLVHLFFVSVALAGSYARSPLQSRILQRFAFYTQLLNIDLDFKPYYLTHARETDVDHFLEIVQAGAEEPVLRLPARGAWPGSQQHHRQQRLAAVMAYLAEDEARAARMAQAVGEHVLHVRGVVPAQIRVRRHMLVDWEVIGTGSVAERDPDSELYFRTPYAVNCLVQEGGRVRVARVEAADQVARPPVSPPASEQP